jgi:3,4-dihydroxy 2-butanone 4-phosphate synthase / GTP cyclohydrolase II
MTKESNIMPADISDALEALLRGNAVIVVDDEDRENEGDIILAAEHASPEWLAWIIQVSTGFVCAPMPQWDCGHAQAAADDAG